MAATLIGWVHSMYVSGYKYSLLTYTT